MSAKKIMLVDDEERFVFTLSKRLAKRGYEVQTASNGMEALEKLAQDEVEVTILDVKMPVMDGLTTLKEVKKRNPLIEVILLTGHGSIDAAVEGLSAGAFDYLLKPCDHSRLLSKIELASKRRSEHESCLKQGGSWDPVNRMCEL
jgi:DNA-binding NtrC family response regulator